MELKARSRKTYDDKIREDLYPGDNVIKIGCLQRIADACEIMCKERVVLEVDNEFYRQRIEELDEIIQRLRRSNASLRGCITRLKKIL